MEKMIIVSEIMVRWAECLGNINDVPEFHFLSDDEVDKTANYAVRSIIKGLQYSVFELLHSEQPGNSYDPPNVEEYVAFGPTLYLIKRFRKLIHDSQNNETVWFLDEFDLSITEYEIDQVMKTHRKKFTSWQLDKESDEGASRRMVAFGMPEDQVKAIFQVRS